MKKYINKIFILLAISVFLGSCEDDRELTVLNPEANTVATLSSNDVVLEKVNIGQDALSVSWTEPDFGYAASASYQILIDLAGGDFSAAQVVSTGQELSYTFETEELNKKLINLGIKPGDPTAIEIKVKAVLGKYTDVSSDLNSLMATAYADALDLSTPWGVVGSAYNDWGGAGPDAPFYTTETPNVYVAYVTLMDGEWKIRKDNNWDVNFGDDGADGTLEAGGANMTATAGTYMILFDEANLTYTIESYTWGLVGSATTNGWGGPDMPLTYDSYSDTWRAQVRFKVDGEIKIRLNNDWPVNYGDTGLDGTLDAGGDNIPVTSGYYEIQVDLNDLTYTLEETDIWGVVGSGYNNWGEFDDYPFTPDYSKDGLYFINGIELLDGEIKFRINNDWGTDYGDTGLDGILDLGGDNIPSTAGTYNIIMDLSNPDVPVYSIIAK